MIAAIILMLSLQSHSSDDMRTICPTWNAPGDHYNCEETERRNNLVEILILHGINYAVRIDTEEYPYPYPLPTMGEELCQLFDVATYETIDATIEMGMDDVDYCF